MVSTVTPLLASTSSDKQRMLGALMAAFRGHELTSDQLLPAMVSSYDRTNNTAIIQPLIQWVDVNNGLHTRNLLSNISVLSMGGGGFHINFPLKKGDLGWIVASDRDISLFKQSLGITPPNSGRLHTFEDGWFVPDVFRQYTIDGADSAAMVIQSTDSLTRISISNGVVNITAPTSVTVTTPQTTFTGNVTVNQNLTVDQNSTIQHALTVAGATGLNGGLTAAGGHACTLPAETTVGGTDVATHGHISASPGNRTSGGMIP
jgi:hypothetical protein